MATIRQAIHDHQEWKTLALLHGFVGVAAVGGGIGLAGGGSGIPERYLEGSSFSSFVIPGLALGSLVGTTSLLAAIAAWRQDKQALEASALASAMLTGWFIVQLAEIGYISWMQPFFITWLFAQISLALRLWTHEPRPVWLDQKRSAAPRRLDR
jgi:hypothetical protein